MFKNFTREAFARSRSMPLLSSWRRFECVDRSRVRVIKVLINLKLQLVLLNLNAFSLRKKAACHWQVLYDSWLLSSLSFKWEPAFSGAVAFFKRKLARDYVSPSRIHSFRRFAIRLFRVATRKLTFLVPTFGIRRLLSVLAFCDSTISFRPCFLQLDDIFSFEFRRLSFAIRPLSWFVAFHLF